jgi:type I restriction enzyme S subunit
MAQERHTLPFQQSPLALRPRFIGDAQPQHTELPQRVADLLLLVPQDPNDEPASVLLERIRAQRAAEGSKAKRGRGAAPGSAEEPKRRGRPPKVQAEAGEQVPSAEGAAQTPDLQPPRPPKVRPEAQAQAPAAIPEASSYEDAVRKLEALKLERAGGTRQVSLFDEEPQPS